MQAQSNDFAASGGELNPKSINVIVSSIREIKDYIAAKDRAKKSDQKLYLPLNYQKYFKKVMGDL